MSTLGYITIIIVALLLTICFLGFKYIDSTYNPRLYEREDDIYAINCIASRLLSKYDAYRLANDKDKYMFRINDEEVTDALENIIDITKIQDKD